MSGSLTRQCCHEINEGCSLHVYVHKDGSGTLVGRARIAGASSPEGGWRIEALPEGTSCNIFDLRVQRHTESRHYVTSTGGFIN